MSIDLNNAQFRKFVSFADEADSYNAIAQIGEVKGHNASGVLQNRKIEAKSQLDWVGNVLRFSKSRTTNNAVRELFLNTVLKMCNVSSVEQLPESVQSALVLDDYGKGKPLTARRILAVTDALKSEAEMEAKKRVDEMAPLAAQLGITGKSSGKIASICVPGSGLEEAKDPKAELQRRMNTVATAAVQTGAASVVAGMRKKDGEFDFDQYAGTFEVDLARHFPIKFNNGPTVDTLGSEKARDAYVEFLTDGKVKTYAEADRQTKIKVAALISFTTQGFSACAIKGVGNAFDENGSTTRLNVGRLSAGVSRTDYFDITKDKDGNIIIQHDLTFRSPAVIMKDEKQTPGIYPLNEGSTMEYHFNVTVSAESLERFANADWKDFNEGEISEIENDIERPHCVEEAANALPKDFKLDVAVDLSFKINADEMDVS